MRLRTLIPIISIPLLTACGENWQGFVYPNKSNLANYLYIGNYKSLEECRESARWNISNQRLTATADYECGLNCAPLREGRGLDSTRVCDKTER